MNLPAGTRRLFSSYEEDDLAPDRGESLLIARLLEDGDSADLSWLAARTSEPTLAEWLGRHGRRQLSRRSRAFWEVVLGREAGPSVPGAKELWPL